jgi:hypothetical protein
VWPEIQWKTVEGQDKPYVGLKGTYTRKPFNQERLDTALRDLKERYVTLVPITDDADYQLQMGDACVVNMDGYMAADDGVTKGEPLPAAASGDRVDVVLGKGRYMEGLVEGLVGAKVGETRTVTVSFPDVSVTLTTTKTFSRQMGKLCAYTYSPHSEMTSHLFPPWIFQSLYRNFVIKHWQGKRLYLMSKY